MTVKQLKDAIKDFPDDMDVMIEKTDDEFHFGLLESAQIKEVTFQSSEEEEAEQGVVVLSDEIKN